MIMIPVLWLLVGAGFGWPRARHAFKSYTANPEVTKFEAWRGAIGVFLSWTLLGLYSAISFLAWVALTLALTHEDEIKKMGTFEALLFSIAVFVLGYIALEGDANKNSATRRELKK
ncbi:MAG: hypothetical protein ACR2PV_03055 [Gammaproteobacteria bacterium]